MPNPVDWGGLPSQPTRDMLAQGSRLYVATDRGVAVLRGMALTALRGSDGLPYEGTTCLAEGFDGDLWIGTTRGAIRKAGDVYHYFGARHWLPGDFVHDMATGDRAVYIATDKGPQNGTRLVPPLGIFAGFDSIKPAVHPKLIVPAIAREALLD